MTISFLDFGGEWCVECRVSAGRFYRRTNIRATAAARPFVWAFAST
jgi:hypothetical protein